MLYSTPGFFEARRLAGSSEPSWGLLARTQAYSVLPRQNVHFCRFRPGRPLRPGRVRQGGYLRIRLPLAWKSIINQDEYYVEIEFAKGTQKEEVQECRTAGVREL